MSAAGVPVTRFDIASGEWRGTQLSLHPTYLVHRGDAHLEMLPLAALASVRVSFERDGRRIRWGIALLVLALLLFAIAGPLESFTGTAVREMTVQHGGGATGVAAALLGLFRVVEGLAKLLPFLAAALALGGGALCALGWLGTTTLALTFAGGERLYVVRGKDGLLLDFSERVSEALAALKR
jgi:hypothetical protein